MNIPNSLKSLSDLIRNYKDLAIPPIKSEEIYKVMCNGVYDIYRNTIGLDEEYRTHVFDLTQHVTAKKWDESIAIIALLVRDVPVERQIEAPIVPITPITEPTGIPILAPGAKRKGTKPTKADFVPTPLVKGKPKAVKFGSTFENASPSNKMIMERAAKNLNPQRKNQKKGGKLGNAATDQPGDN